MSESERELIIQVLGPGCSKCNFLEQRARLALSAIQAEHPEVMGRVEKVSDLDVFLHYGLLTTPGLVINDRLVCAGRVASERVITEWLRAEMEKRD